MADPVWVDGVTPLDSAHMTKLQTRDEKGQPNGYASLDAGGKVPSTQIPAVAGIPTGASLDFFGTVAPAGFLLCDGSAISRTAYAALYAVIGTAYGPGDGGTTFNLPDTRGRATVGLGPNADVATLGANDGLATASRRPKHNHSHNLSLPDHGHGVSDPGHVHAALNGQFKSNVPLGQGITDQEGGGNQTNYYNTTAAAGTGIAVGGITSVPGINGQVGPAGANPVDTTPYLVCNKIIKT